MKPYMIVTAGPTGSGKTMLVNEVIDYLELDPHYVKVLIDDLVENDDEYKQMVYNIITTKNFDNIMEELNNAYFYVRNKKRSDQYPTNYNEINDEKLMNAIKHRKNIVFEFTGTYIPTWLLKDIDNYNIIFAYTTVCLQKLKERNQLRMKYALEKFEIDPNNNPAPRLPNISDQIFTKLILTIRDNLKNLYKYCIKNRIVKKCGTSPIGRLLIYNNSGKNMRLMVDSMSNRLTYSKFNSVIDKLFEIHINKCDAASRSKKSSKKRRRRRRSIRRV